MEEGAAHPVEWWAELLAASAQFDAPYFVEELTTALAPRITNPLVRREIELAAATVNRHLLRPLDEYLADDAQAARQRLRNTLDRVDADSTRLTEAWVINAAVGGDYPGAAAGAEPLLGAQPTLLLAMTALRLERFDTELAVNLLAAGRSPEEAIRYGGLVGRYAWWPKWLLEIGARRAMDGTLNEGVITALDACAFAKLTAAQTHIARKLLSGDERALRTAAEHLDTIGEATAAEELRNGDLTPVALAAKMMTL
ncbi:hypothetical protein [Catenuloplanes atrovinosus]|uniref:Uncharacterized protein n=1 Tax=Catenuloplanes atrovinosus TaxID=137266 RepID=A0AAE3YL03_9ACTN|nr:hypothetical protein [Catenuloplanes atrovinosus]MDR7273756.1 hypothetical protein [Catenuloplanes atrovinosus]